MLRFKNYTLDSSRLKQRRFQICVEIIFFDVHQQTVSIPINYNLIGSIESKTSTIISVNNPPPPPPRDMTCLTNAIIVNA